MGDDNHHALKGAHCPPIELILLLLPWLWMLPYLLLFGIRWQQN